MILIHIQFDSGGAGKTYQYLLINPGHYKIDQTRPLLYRRGATTLGPIINKMYAVKAEKVSRLPDVVSKQIVLLDNENNIIIQALGRSALPNAEIKPTPVPEKKTEKSQKTKSAGEVKKTKSVDVHSEIVDSMMREHLTAMRKNTNKILKGRK